MSERWWEVNSWRIEPRPITVVSSTEKTIIIKGENGWGERKALKHSDGFDYFTTWKEARQFVIDRERAKREHAAELMRKITEDVRLALELPEEEPA